MAIPSYDDLTPSIPDVKPGEVFSCGCGAAGPGLKQQSGLGARGSGLAAGSQDPGPQVKKRHWRRLRVPSPESRAPILRPR